MNNEIMAKALSELDDDLVEEASEFSSRKTKKRGAVKGILAFAACLAVTAAFSFSFFFSEKVEVGFEGKPLSDFPVAVSDSGDEMPFILRINAYEIEIPLEIDGKGKTKLKALDGKLFLSDFDEGETEIELSGVFSVSWVVQYPDEEKEYTLKVGKNTVLTLSFDETLNKWTILKTTRR